jgi:hypothetical protein
MPNEQMQTQHMKVMMQQMLAPENVKAVAVLIKEPEAKARTAISTALPVLVAALGQEASSPQGAEKLAAALDKDHDGSILEELDAYVVTGGDVVQGRKILKHVLGERQAQVEQRLAATAKVDVADMSNVMAGLAPVIMAALAADVRENHIPSRGIADLLLGSNSPIAPLLGGGSQGGASAGGGMAGVLGGAIGSALLGGLLGGGSGGQGSQSSSSDMIGSLLGGLMGGGGAAQGGGASGSGGAMGALLGGLLGGGGQSGSASGSSDMIGSLLGGLMGGGAPSGPAAQQGGGDPSAALGSLLTGLLTGGATGAAPPKPAGSKPKPAGAAKPAAAKPKPASAKPPAAPKPAAGPKPAGSKPKPGGSKPDSSAGSGGSLTDFIAGMDTKK